MAATENPGCDAHGKSALCRLLHRGILRDMLVVAVLIFGRMNSTLLIVGVIVFAVGAVLHVWSKACLMRNFMVTRNGPYRFVRHPFYLANLVIDVGICCIAGNLYLLIAYVPLYLLAYIPTIRQEERDLTATHGDGYRQYVREIPMLISLRIDRIVGPWDGTWTNIWRENEFTRLGRILAIPFYILLVDALILNNLIGERSVSLAVVAAVVAIAINIFASRAKKLSRRRLMVMSDFTDLEGI